MTSQMSSHQKVMNAWVAWLMALRIWENIDKLIESSLFENWSARLGNAEIRVRALGAGNIRNIAHNLFILTLGGCVIATQEALEDEFGKFSVSFLNRDISNLVALRAVIYQMRNAFAHRATNPKWRICKEKYKREYHIKDGELEIRVDLRNLNNQEFDLNHIGGWEGFNRLITYAMNQLENKRKDVYHYLPDLKGN